MSNHPKEVLSGTMDVSLFRSLPGLLVPIFSLLDRYCPVLGSRLLGPLPLQSHATRQRIPAAHFPGYRSQDGQPAGHHDERQSAPEEGKPEVRRSHGEEAQRSGWGRTEG